MGHFDIDGEPITLGEWAVITEKFERRVALTETKDGWCISTVWLGLDHSFSMAGPPVIFETMVFGPFDFGDKDCERYSALQEAKEGHARMVAKWGLIHRASHMPRLIYEEVRDRLKHLQRYGTTDRFEVLDGLVKEIKAGRKKV